jgi:hypothetical protein
VSRQLASTAPKCAPATSAPATRPAFAT